jgi:pectinesterase
MKRLLTPLLFIPGLLVCQAGQGGKDVPRDTSFTLASAWRGIQGEYPEARPVIPERPSRSVLKEDIVYDASGSRTLHLDLLLPDAETGGSRAAVVLIHGGGWRSGSRQMEYPMACYLASHGYVAAMVEYRLSGEARYPAAVVDLKAAVRWLRSNAHRYGIDPARIAAYGCSSGGELAAFLGVTGDNPAFEGEHVTGGGSSAVQAVVDVDGILDFTHPAESGKDTGSAPASAGKAWLGFSYRENPEVWRQASPLNHVTMKTPPILFINSSRERFHAGRDEMIARMKSWGIFTELRTHADAPHPFWLFHPWFEPTGEWIIHFLERVLSAGGG